LLYGIFGITGVLSIRQKYIPVMSSYNKCPGKVFEELGIVDIFCVMKYNNGFVM